MVSTPADLDKFIEALFAGKLIKPAGLELMKTTKDGYGMAMFLTLYDDKQSYGHGGSIDAYRSELAYFLRKDRGVVHLQRRWLRHRKDL
jgi:D-alanyl-D-alanine carboxypeptidase